MPEQKRVVQFKEHPFLLELTWPGYVWQGKLPEETVVIVASGGDHEEWAAYYQNPWCGNNVLDYGNKLPKTVAEFFFPEMAKKFRYRP
jgi:hypothetical protein